MARLRWRPLFTSTCFPFLVAFLIPDPPLGAFLVRIVQRLVRQHSAILVEVFLPQSILLTRRGVHVHRKPRYPACEICWRRWILKFGFVHAAQRDRFVFLVWNGLVPSPTEFVLG